jgi:hypothetical protein
MVSPLEAICQGRKQFGETRVPAEARVFLPPSTPIKMELSSSQPMYPAAHRPSPLSRNRQGSGQVSEGLSRRHERLSGDDPTYSFIIPDWGDFFTAGFDSIEDFL